MRSTLTNPVWLIVYVTAFGVVIAVVIAYVQRDRPKIRLRFQQAVAATKGEMVFGLLVSNHGGRDVLDATVRGYISGLLVVELPDKYDIPCGGAPVSIQLRIPIGSTYGYIDAEGLAHLTGNLSATVSHKRSIRWARATYSSRA